MGITVRHDPSGAAIGQSAYTIGQGQKKERDREFGLKATQVAIQGSAAASAASARSRALALQEKRNQQDVNFREKAYDDAPARELEMGLVQQQLLEKNFQWQYTEQQKRELEKVNSGIAWTRQQVAEGAWTPEQAEVAERQLQMRYHGIIPSKVYDDSPSPQDVFNSQVVKNNNGIAVGYMNPKTGRIESLPNTVTPKEFNGFLEMAQTALGTKTVKGKDGKPTTQLVAVSAEDAMAYAVKLAAQYQQFQQQLSMSPEERQQAANKMSYEKGFNKPPEEYPDAKWDETRQVWIVTKNGKKYAVQQ